MNHIRYAFYWEAYEKDPKAFMKELKTVAKTADKHNLKVIYDNHQYHTSSWLDSTNGTGFPSKLFDINKYKNGAGGVLHMIRLQKNGGMSGGTIKSKMVKEILGGHCKLHFSNELLIL